jgi:hypothetical protein
MPNAKTGDTKANMNDYASPQKLLSDKELAHLKQTQYLEILKASKALEFTREMLKARESEENIRNARRENVKKIVEQIKGGSFDLQSIMMGFFKEFSREVASAASEKPFGAKEFNALFQKLMFKNLPANTTSEDKKLLKNIVFQNEQVNPVLNAIQQDFENKLMYLIGPRMLIRLKKMSYENNGTYAIPVRQSPWGKFLSVSVPKTMSEVLADIKSSIAEPDELKKIINTYFHLPRISLGASSRFFTTEDIVTSLKSWEKEKKSGGSGDEWEKIVQDQEFKEFLDTADSSVIQNRKKELDVEIEQLNKKIEFHSAEVKHSKGEAHKELDESYKAVTEIVTKLQEQSDRLTQRLNQLTGNAPEVEKPRGIGGTVLDVVKANAARLFGKEARDEVAYRIKKFMDWAGVIKPIASGVNDLLRGKTRRKEDKLKVTYYGDEKDNIIAQQRSDLDDKRNEYLKWQNEQDSRRDQKAEVSHVDKVEKKKNMGSVKPISNIVNYDIIKEREDKKNAETDKKNKQWEENARMYEKISRQPVPQQPANLDIYKIVGKQYEKRGTSQEYIEKIVEIPIDESFDYYSMYNTFKKDEDAKKDQEYNATSQKIYLDDDAWAFYTSLQDKDVLADKRAEYKEMLAQQAKLSPLVQPVVAPPQVIVTQQPITPTSASVTPSPSSAGKQQSVQPEALHPKKKPLPQIPLSGRLGMRSPEVKSEDKQFYGLCNGKYFSMRFSDINQVLKEGDKVQSYKPGIFQGIMQGLSSPKLVTPAIITEQRAKNSAKRLVVEMSERDYKAYESYEAYRKKSEYFDKPEKFLAEMGVVLRDLGTKLKKAKAVLTDPECVVARCFPIWIELDDLLEKAQKLVKDAGSQGKYAELIYSLGYDSDKTARIELLHAESEPNLKKAATQKNKAEPKAKAEVKVDAEAEAKAEVEAENAKRLRCIDVIGRMAASLNTVVGEYKEVNVTPSIEQKKSDDKEKEILQDRESQQQWDCKNDPKAFVDKGQKIMEDLLSVALAAQRDRKTNTDKAKGIQSHVKILLDSLRDDEIGPDMAEVKDDFKQTVDEVLKALNASASPDKSFEKTIQKMAVMLKGVREDMEKEEQIDVDANKEVQKTNNTVS